MSVTYVAKELREAVSNEARHRCGYCLTQERSVHFCWTTEGDQIVGRTPVGRATVLALHLNRPAIVLSRREWVCVGWHPPADTYEPSR